MTLAKKERARRGRAKLKALRHGVTQIENALVLQGLVDGAVAAANDLSRGSEVTGAEALAIAVIERLGPGPKARLAAALEAGEH